MDRSLLQQQGGSLHLVTSLAVMLISKTAIIGICTLTSLFWIRLIVVDVVME